MDLRKRMLGTFGIVAVLLALSWFLTGLGFSGWLHAQKNQWTAARSEWGRIESLLAGHKEEEAAWKLYEGFLLQGMSPTEALNLWIQDLTSFGNSEEIVFRRLEPVPSKDMGAKETELRLSVDYEGQIEKLIRLISYLERKDPFTRIESLWIKQDDAGKLQYTLTLARTIG